MTTQSRYKPELHVHAEKAAVMTRGQWRAARDMGKSICRFCAGPVKEAGCDHCYACAASNLDAAAGAPCSCAV
jgi:hypothetical protein